MRSFEVASAWIALAACLASCGTAPAGDAGGMDAARMDASSADASEIDADSGDPPGACSDHELDGELRALPALGVRVVADGAPAEWGASPPQIADLRAEADRCAPAGGAGADLYGVWLASSPDAVSARVDGDFAGSGAIELVLELRSIGPIAGGAGDVDVVARRSDAGAWTAHVEAIARDGTRVERGPIEIGAVEDVVELVVSRTDVGTLSNRRLRARVRAGALEDATSFVQIANGTGVAGPDGVPTLIERALAIVEPDRTRADLDEAIAGVPELSLADFDEASGLASLDVAAADRSSAQAAVEGLAAHAAVASAALVPIVSAERGWTDNALSDYRAHADGPAAMWAYELPQIVGAQQVVASCWGIGDRVWDVHVGVIDVDMPAVVSGGAPSIEELTRVRTVGVREPCTATGFERLRTCHRDWDEEGGGHQGPVVESHGYAVASILAERIAPVRPATVTLAGSATAGFTGDRLSGALSFRDEDGVEMPIILELANAHYAGAALRTQLEVAAAVAPRGWQVINASFGANAFAVYCEDLEQCYSDSVPGCTCAADIRRREHCGSQGRLSDVQFQTMSEGLRAAVRSGESSLWVFAAGNECMDLAEGLASSSMLAGELNVLVVGSLDNDGVVQIARHSNYGTGVDLWAPGFGVMAWTPAVQHAHDPTLGLINTMTHRGRRAWVSGTSVAAPLVSAAAAMVRAAAPDLTAAEAGRWLVDTADVVTLTRPRMPRPRVGAAPQTYDLEGRPTVPVLNAARAATRALLRTRGEGRNRILQVEHTEITAACPGGLLPVFREVRASCITILESGAGALSGGRGTMPDTDGHTLSGTIGGASITFTISGTDHSPAFGSSSTTYTGTLQRPAMALGDAVRDIREGTFSGGDGSCTWTGTFTGRLFSAD